MNHLFYRDNRLILLSAVLFALSLIATQFYLAWLCLCPLFVVLQERKGKTVFYKGALFGWLTGLLLFYWLIPVVTFFTGGSWFLGLLTYLVAPVFSAVYFGLLLRCFAWLKQSGRFAAGLNALLIAALWTAGEGLLAALFTGMPWFGFHAGNALLDNLYAIQPAELGGIFLLSFCVVLVNYILAGLIVRKQWKLLWLPVALVLVILATGYGLLYRFQQQEGKLSRRPVSVAILCENAVPDIKWDKNNGGILVKRLLELNARAASLRPDLILWTESAVPWTYRPDDDFVKEVIQTTGPLGITHIIGINTDYKEEEVYNSAYCLLPDGKVAGRYFKRFLLSLVEQPLSFYSLPFLSTDGFHAKAGEESLPFETPYGKIGILICNEATVSAAAVDMVGNGAEALVNISNDGWFSNIPYLVNQHFFNARLRAVEVRRDIVVNSNLGISGKVAASGIADRQPRSDTGIVAKYSLQKNNYTTLYASMSAWFLYGTSLVILSFIIPCFIRSRKS